MCVCVCVCVRYHEIAGKSFVGTDVGTVAIYVTFIIIPYLSYFP